VRLRRGPTLTLSRKSDRLTALRRSSPRPTGEGGRVRVREAKRLRPLTQEAVDEGGLAGAVRSGEEDEGGAHHGQMHSQVVSKARPLVVFKIALGVSTFKRGDILFRMLGSAMRDADVRQVMRQMLREQHAGEPDTIIVEEMGVWSGSVRIDMAVINGELSGFELKSDRDTLDRLPFQADLYSRVFDRVSIVAGARHGSKAFSKVPDWWGQMIAHPTPTGVKLEEIKSSDMNPRREPYLIAELLRKEEVILALSERNLANGWRGKRIKLLHQRLAENLSLDELCACVRQTLKAREGWLRKSISSNFDMSISADLNPALQVSGTSATCYGINSLISPAVS